ncbi:MAG: signal peptide peptidase SppA, partial [Sedimentisphaerales bacterium]|nr:signal peptide peptidase SppA [Sedimentisphaerales bacterium]
QNDNPSIPTGSQSSGPNYNPALGGPAMVAPRRKGSGWKIFWGIALALSFIANVVLFLMLIGVIVMFATGQTGVLDEEIIREGPSRTKIAMISLQGVIYGETASDIYRQLKIVRKDRHVKAVIVRVNSPGGTISASDQIYMEINKFRKEENIPVVAFMQGVAASGGYYTSVACDQIIAEPTTITGSIGVISWYLVMQELLEDKLGILPVTIKSGEKKDWPSSFRKPEPEEIQYMQDKVITPALERFIKVIAEGRKASLTIEEIRVLADGGIYGAKEAKEEKLIDEIGYLDEAIDLAKSLAGIDKAQVVQYRKPFSISDVFSYRKPNMFKFDRATLYELGTPQILYLWSTY